MQPSNGFLIRRCDHLRKMFGRALARPYAPVRAIRNSDKFHRSPRRFQALGNARRQIAPERISEEPARAVGPKSLHLGRISSGHGVQAGMFFLSAEHARLHSENRNARVESMGQGLIHANAPPDRMEANEGWFRSTGS